MSNEKIFVVGSLMVNSGITSKSEIFEISKSLEVNLNNDFL